MSLSPPSEEHRLGTSCHSTSPQLKLSAVISENHIERPLTVQSRLSSVSGDPLDFALSTRRGNQLPIAGEIAPSVTRKIANRQSPRKLRTSTRQGDQQRLWSSFRRRRRTFTLVEANARRGWESRGRTGI